MLGVDESAEIVRYLKEEGLIDAGGRVLDALRRALKEDRLALPDAQAAHLPQVGAILRKIAGRLEIRNADDRKTVKARRAVLHSAEFRALWDRIKHKTTYRVRFDNEKLIGDCAVAIRDGPPVPRARITVRKADLAIGQGGVLTRETATSAPIAVDEGDIALPDLVTELQDRTQLTRRSLVRILLECGRLDDFRRNPQAFIESAAELVNRAKRRALVDGIRYQRVGDGEFYAQELFELEELTGYLESMLMDTRKSVFEHVVHDSTGVERRFAEEMERNESVRVYAKLPAWFKVPTPLGSYNPDWAVLVEAEGQQAPLSGGRDEGQPVRRRAAHERGRQDRLRQGAFRGPGKGGKRTGALRDRDQARRRLRSGRGRPDLLREPATIRCPDRHCSRERLSRGQAFPLAVDGGNRPCGAGRWVPDRGICSVRPVGRDRGSRRTSHIPAPVVSAQRAGLDRAFSQRGELLAAEAQEAKLDGLPCVGCV